jgi:hypothetical protein
MNLIDSLAPPGLWLTIPHSLGRITDEIARLVRLVEGEPNDSDNNGE